MIRLIFLTLWLWFGLTTTAMAQLVVRAASVDDISGGNTRGALAREQIVDSGTVTYRSIIDGAPPTSDAAWWQDAGLALREGDDAPGLPGLTLIPLSGVTGNSTKLLHVSFLDNAPTTADLALFLDDTLVAREGDLVPGSGGADRYGDFPNIADLSLQGNRLAFTWNTVDATSGASTGFGLFKGPANDPQLVARTGEQAAGLPGGFVYDSLSDISLSPANQLAFIGSASDPGRRGTFVEGVWQTEFGTTPHLIINTGELGPGNIGPIEDIQDISFTSGDDLIIQAGIAPFPSSANAVWITGPGTVPVKSGDLIDGSTLSFVTKVAGNGNKRMAFLCHFSTFVGLCLADPLKGVDILIREGDPAPEIGGGVTIATLRTQPTLNRFDQIAFYVLLSGTGVDFTNDEALYFRHSTGEITLVAREGDSYNLGPLGVATIHATAASPSALEFRDNGSMSDRFGQYDGQQSPVTETGTVVLWANFLGNQEFEAILTSTPDPEGIFWDGFDAVDLN